MGKTKLKKMTVINAMYNNKGILAKAARELGVTRKTLYNYINRWPAVKEAYKDAGNETLDLAEQGLYKHIKDGHLGAIMFVLKTKGRSRGYVERNEVQEVSEVEITVKRDDDE